MKEDGERKEEEERITNRTCDYFLTIDTSKFLAYFIMTKIKKQQKTFVVGPKTESSRLFQENRILSESTSRNSVLL